jgi:hypothetical protein
VNTQYADTVTSINNLKSAARSMDFDGDYAASNMGQLLRRIMSNQVSRNRIEAIVDEMYNVHTKYGGQSKHDPRTLMMFADELDSAFGDSAPYSFMGQVAQGTKHGIQNAASGRGKQTLWEGVVDPVLKGVQGINEPNAFKIIDDILNYTPATK